MTPSPARRGYTLIELSVSLVAASILMAGMGSSIYLASRASQSGIGSFQGSRQAGELLGEMGRELAYATAIDATVTNSQRVKCTVPDYTGDGMDDVIQYSWSGTAGAPLLKTVNTGTAVSVADDVQHFQLDFQKRAKDGGNSTESATQQWLNDLSSGSAANFTVGSGDPLGQYFLPMLPANATAWRITRVDVRVRRTGTVDGVLRVQVRQAGSGYTPGTVLEEVTISEARFSSSYSTYTVSFPGTTSLSPSQAACIVFQQDLGTSGAAQIEYGTSSTATANSRLLDTWLGLFWSSHSTQDVHLGVWGTYTGPPGTGTQEFYYTTVDAALQIGTRTATRGHLGVPLINYPQAPGP